jgi:endonuclease/exonuclease/phosphatase (EEP) superfamily protein YafD
VKIRDIMSPVSAGSRQRPGGGGAKDRAMSWMGFQQQLEKLAVFGTAVIAGASALALMARFGWFAELFSHFRLQYALASLMLAGVFALSHRRRLALVALTLAVPNIWSVSPYLVPLLVPPSVAEPAGEDIGIISLNLYYRNKQYSTVRDYLAGSRADVLVLSELTPEWTRELHPVTGSYPYWMSVDRRSPWGLGVFSRYPLLDARVTDLGVRGSVNVIATVALPGGNVQLVGVHLVSPPGPGRAALRNRQLAELASLLGPPVAPGVAPKMPRILIGDMNVTPFSPYFTNFLAQTGMEDERRAHGPNGTWPTWMLPLQIAIDHCIADPGLDVTRVARGPDVGSDHYPLEVTLRQHG